MKRSFFLLALLVLLSLVAAQCAGPAATPAPPEATEAPAAATEAPAAATEAPAAAQVEAFTCEDAIGCVDIPPGDPIRIGYALVLSGPNETLGIDSRRGIEIAIDDKPEVLGHPVELVGEDSLCSAEGGQTALTKLVSDPSLIAIIGTNCSSAGEPASKIASDAGMVLISPSNTAPSLTNPAATWNPGYLRTAHNDNVQGAAMANFVYNELGLRKAATIHDGSPYADQLQQVFADTFKRLGGEITTQEAVNVGDTDMRPVLTKIAATGPEFLYYPIFIAEGAFITVQAKEVAGLEDVALAGADGLISPDFVAAAGEAAEGMYHSGPDLAFDNPLGQAFLEKHREKYGEEPLSAFHAHAYDATNMIFAAIEKVAVEDADGVLHIGRQALRDALYDTNMEGITGNINCNETGDCADPHIRVTQIQNGEYVPIWPPEEGTMAPEAEAAAGPELADELYVFNWADYIDEELLTMYEEETGVKVIYDTFDSNEDLLAKLQAGATGYDVIFPSDYMVTQMIDLGLLAELDLNNIPNFQYVAEFNKDPAYDPGNKHSVPYFWGTTGIGYDADVVDPPPDSWAWIFDPEVACQYQDGGINVLDDERELIGAALKYLGYSLNDTDEAHLDQARDVILAAKPCWKTFDSSGYIENLMIPGEIVLGQAWNGDVFVAAEENEAWAYVMPNEGGTVWQDNMCVPASSTRQATAEHFINWMLDPEHAGQNTNYVWYASPVEAAKEFIDPEIVEDPAIYLDDETISRLEWIESLPTDALAIWDRVWTEIKAQ